MDLTQENMYGKTKMEIQKGFPNQFCCTHVRKDQTDQQTQGTWEYRESKAVKKKFRFCRDRDTREKKKEC